MAYYNNFEDIVCMQKILYYFNLYCLHTPTVRPHFLFFFFAIKCEIFTAFC